MIRIYLLSLPFVNAFAFSTVLIWPLIISLLMFMKLIFNYKIFRFKINAFNIIYIFFLMIVSLSLLLNLNHLDVKMLNHSIAFFSVVVLFYFIPSIFINEISIERILKYLSIIFFVVLLFSVIEFILINFMNNNLINLIPRPSIEYYKPTFIIYIRARCFFEESGHFASFLATLLPFVYLYIFRLKKNITLKYIFIILFFLATFAVASVSLLLIITLLFILLNVKKFFKTRLFAILAILLIPLFLIMFESLYNVFDLVVLNKFASGSFEDRWSKLFITLNYIYKNGTYEILFGYGPGSYNYLKIIPSITFYINLLRDLGLAGLITFFILNIFTYFYIIDHIKQEYQKYFLFSLFSILLFLLAIPNYFFPHFQLVYLLAQHKEFKK